MESTAKPQTLTDMAMGYSRSRALSAAARLGVADALGDGQDDGFAGQKGRQGDGFFVDKVERHLLQA